MAEPIVSLILGTLKLKDHHWLFGIIIIIGIIIGISISVSISIGKIIGKII
jgi:hypothetical protein